VAEVLRSAAGGDGRVGRGAKGCCGVRWSSARLVARSRGSTRSVGRRGGGRPVGRSGGGRPVGRRGGGRPVE